MNTKFWKEAMCETIVHRPRMHLVILVETRSMRGILALFDLFIFSASKATI